MNPTNAMRRACQGALLGAIGLAWSAGPLGAAESQAYVRTLQGTAGFHDASLLEEREVVENAPLLPGDRVSVDAGSRLEVEFPDGTRLRADDASQFTVVEIALALERPAAATEVRLHSGRLQLAVPSRLSAAADPRVDTANASVYGLASASFRVASDGAGYSEVVVRSGEVDVVTRRGTTRVAAGQGLEVSGESWPRLQAFRAGPLDALETWAFSLDEEAERWASAEVDAGLRYASARLSQLGVWIDLGGRRAWRPRAVHGGWRPFVDGRWVHTPAGLTWVSYEPWGWVTSHYGQWDWIAGYGWVWLPGGAYSPAWVHWYWGPSRVGWCPSGYYNRFYASASFGHRGWGLGVFGWAGGDPHAFRDWTFCSLASLRQRRLRDHCRTGWDPTWSGGRPDRGLITTDTRPLGRRGWDDPGIGLDRLRQAAVPVAAHRLNPDAPTVVRDGDLPDANAFVARRPDLPAGLRNRLDTLPSAVAVGLLPGTRDPGGREPAVEAPAGAAIPGWSPVSGRDRAAAARPTEPYVVAPPSTPRGAPRVRMPSEAPAASVRPAAEPVPAAGAGSAGVRAPGREPIRPSGGSGAAAPGETPPTVRRILDGLRPRGGTVEAPAASGRAPGVAPPPGAAVRPEPPSAARREPATVTPSSPPSRPGIAAPPVPRVEPPAASAPSSPPPATPRSVASGAQRGSGAASPARGARQDSRGASSSRRNAEPASSPPGGRRASGANG